MVAEKTPYVMVPVEAQILRHICMRADASYKSFHEDFTQDRTSLIRYVQNLFQNQYIHKQSAVEGMEKSKLYFKPTQKGVLYAVLNLRLDYDVIGRLHDTENYEMLIDVVPEKQTRDWWVQMYAKHTLARNTFIKGRVSAESENEAIALFLSVLTDMAIQDRLTDSFLLFLVESLGSKYLPMLRKKLIELDRKVTDMIAKVGKLEGKYESTNTIKIG